MKYFASILSFLAMVPDIAQAQQPICELPVAFTVRDKISVGRYRNLKIYQINDQSGSPWAYAFVSRLRLNTDGAGRSYHPIGTSAGALNTICNGIAVSRRNPNGTRTRISSIAPLTMSAEARCQYILDTFRKSRDNNWAIDQNNFIDFYAIAHQPTQNQQYRPCIQTSGPNAGFFVSTTAQIRARWGNICEPNRYLDSYTTNYVTVPSNSVQFANAGISVGQPAAVYTGAVSLDAVVGDSGNADELGEASIEVHRALREIEPADFDKFSPAQIKGSLFREPVLTVIGVTALFRNEDSTPAFREHVEDKIDLQKLRNCLSYEISQWGP